jgi:hypothetical protein
VHFTMEPREILKVFFYCCFRVVWAVILHTANSPSSLSLVFTEYGLTLTHYVQLHKTSLVLLSFYAIPYFLFLVSYTPILYVCLVSLFEQINTKVFKEQYILTTNNLPKKMSSWQSVISCIFSWLSCLHFTQHKIVCLASSWFLHMGQ